MKLDLGRARRHLARVRHTLFQTLSPGGRFERHRHDRAYAALVLAGGYVEAGDRGRFRARPGQVLFHGPWEAHMDAFSGAGAVVLNLPLTEEVTFGAGTVANPDAVARAAERNPAEAGALLLRTTEPLAEPPEDWPDLLAGALRNDQHLSIERWAEDAGLDPATVSRGFRRVFGASPRWYRAEQRALAAARMLVRGDEPPAALAAELGFSDQAHMTRAVAELTGFTPGQLRIKWIQSGVAALG